MNEFIYNNRYKPKTKLSMQSSLGIVPSSIQTKKWRFSQEWYINGKHNECEKYQLKQLKLIMENEYDTDPVGATELENTYDTDPARIVELENTYDRFDTETNEIIDIKNPFKFLDGFKFSENFDKKTMIDGKTYYFNLKFVCDIGGAQTRSLREVYNFIKCQTSYNNRNVHFINILDGDTCSKYIDSIKTLLKTKRNKKLIFIGDMYDFCDYWMMHRPQSD